MTALIGNRVLRRQDPALSTGEAPLITIVDALSPFGVRDIPMPASPQGVWAAMAGAGAAQQHNQEVQK